MDPLVDESVTMAKRLKKHGVSVGLDVLRGLPHAFLHLIQVIISSQFYKLTFSKRFEFLEQKIGFKRCLRS